MYGTFFGFCQAVHSLTKGSGDDVAGARLGSFCKNIGSERSIRATTPLKPRFTNVQLAFARHGAKQQTSLLLLCGLLKKGL
jgi:hypothetical protein